METIDVEAAKAFQFSVRQFSGVYSNATLCTAVWQFEGGALESHPEGQRLHVISVYVRVVSDTTLGRPECGVVLAPISLEHLQRAVV